MFKARAVKRSSGLTQQSNLLSTLAYLVAKSVKHFAWFRSTKMKSAIPGVNISPVEVTNISPHGFWLLLADEELFLPFSEFPWFRDVTIDKILHVELPSPNHLYWPDLDVDLAVASIRHPDRFPLISQIRA
jgi:hypothetical protein